MGGPRKITPPTSDAPGGYYVNVESKRENRRDRYSNNQKLLMFSFYWHGGMDSWDAYVQAGFCPEGLNEAEQTLHRLRCADLEVDPRVAVLARACREDPRALLRGSLGLVVTGLLDMAFTSRSERIRLKAMTEIMNRGGLPAEAVSLTGKASDLQKLTDSELEEEVLKLLV